MSSISIGQQAMTNPPLQESSGNRLIQFLPEEWQNKIKCTISSPYQENKELTISSLVASWIQTLDKNTKDRIYQDFYKVCGISKTGDPRWGEHNITDPARAGSLVKVFRNIFPKNWSFPLSAVGPHLVGYLDKNSFLNISSSSRQLRKELKDMYPFSRRLTFMDSIGPSLQLITQFKRQIPPNIPFTDIFRFADTELATNIEGVILNGSAVDVKNLYQTYGGTSLFMAIEDKLAPLLIEHCEVDKIRMLSSKVKSRALDFAIDRDDMNMVRSLLVNPSDTNAVVDLDDAVIKSIRNNNFDLVNLLCDDIQVFTVCRIRIFIKESSRNHLDNMEQFFRDLLPRCHEMAERGDTLINAVKDDNIQLVTDLLINNGSEIPYMGKNWAAFNSKNVDIARLILSKGTVVYPDEMSLALERAKYIQNFDLIQFFEEINQKIHKNRHYSIVI